MFDDLKGKKLLILGGMQRTCIIVKRAKDLGMFVIVADYDENSPAKKIADKAVLIDATDKKKLVEYCKINKIDGIMTAYADILLPICKEVANELNIPCYMTDEMLKMSLDKNEFKKQCSIYSVPVPKTFCQEDINNIEYPVFIKPLDASGSRGASLCKNENQIQDALKYAYSFSKSGKITIEQFLTGTEFILDYVIIDGKPFLQSMADRYITPDRPAAINHPNLMIFPSKYLKQYIDEVDSSVKTMFNSLGFKNGLIFMQGYFDDKITFYEMGCRLGGTWPYIDEYFNSVNPLDLLFHHSIYGTMSNSDVKINPQFNGYGANIYFLSKKENVTIKTIKGIDEVKKMDSTVCVIQYHFVGDLLKYGNLTDILLLAVHIVANSFSELKNKINFIYSLIDFYDENNESILAPHYDTTHLNGYHESRKERI